MRFVDLTPFHILVIHVPEYYCLIFCLEFYELIIVYYSKVGCGITTPDGSQLPNVTVAKAGPTGEVKVSYTPVKEGPHQVNITHFMNIHCDLPYTRY